MSASSPISASQTGSGLVWVFGGIIVGSFLFPERPIPVTILECCNSFKKYKINIYQNNRPVYKK
jgi:hypothetical protein